MTSAKATSPNVRYKREALALIEEIAERRRHGLDAGGASPLSLTEYIMMTDKDLRQHAAAWQSAARPSPTTKSAGAAIACKPGECPSPPLHGHRARLPSTDQGTALKR